MSTRHCTLELVESEESRSRRGSPRVERPRAAAPALNVSPWSRSVLKRIFDCTCVLLAFPLLIPVFIAVALAVRVTSRGPILFRQQRTGKLGQSFTILKFRTMRHVKGTAHCAIATTGDQSFTPIGRFLRCWKLDELPQVLNVLCGHMSLVGPRPKMFEHATYLLPCRPGITGAATIAFAREEAALSRVPKDCLHELYHGAVLPAKQHLDNEYMMRATFVSDIRLVVDTILRRWDSSYLDSVIAEAVPRGVPALKSTSESA